MTADHRTAAVRALRIAHETTDDRDARFNVHAANVHAILWLGDLIADLTSAIRETGRNGN